MRRLFRENTWKEMEAADTAQTIVVVPLGATEQHGHHLPLGTDALFTEEVIKRLSEEAHESLMLTILPTLYLGVSVEHMQFPGTLTLEPSTYYRVLMDISKSFAHHGFKKILFLNGHGGNSGLVGTCMFDVRAKWGMLACMVDISSLITAANRPVTTITPEFEDSHGGEMETAMMLAARPDIVQIEKAEITKPERLLKNKVVTHMGPVGLGWLVSDLSPVGSIGNPHHATVQQGNNMLNHIVEVACQALLELDAMDASVSDRK